MAAVLSVTQLLSKYGNRATNAAAEATTKPVEWPQLGLPPGIRNGVAKLQKVEWATVKPGKQMAGEVYCRMVGVAVEPEEVEWDGQLLPVAGLQTSWMQMVCDQPTRGQRAATTVEQNMKTITDMMRMIAGEDFDTSDPDRATVLLNQLAVQLNRDGKGLYFRFATQPKYEIDSKTGKLPIDPVTGQEIRKLTGVWERWYGNRNLDGYVEPKSRDVDNTGGMLVVNGAVATSPAPVQNNGQHRETVTIRPQDVGTMPASVVATPSAEYRDDEDLNSLAVRATAGEDEAVDKLTAFALKAGISQSAIDDPTNGWADIVAMIRKPQPAATTTAVEPELPTPKEGQVWKYRFYDAKRKTTVEVVCMVDKVNATAKTADLTSTADKSVKYTNIRWETLEPV